MSTNQPNKTRVAIVGATGYTALDLLKILARHPHVEVSTITSRQEDEPFLADVHPSLTGLFDLKCENIAPREAASRVDCVFSCLPHGVTNRSVPEMLDAGAKVVDFSADYRLNDQETFTKWYAEEHADAERLSSTPYGLPELFREEIIPAPLVANPGCYPTSAVLALAPLLKAGLIEPEDLVIDSKSGVSGAGRAPKLTTHFPECNESVAAYNIGQHRHTPEIQQVLARSCGTDVDLVFSPHLIPMDRGILTTAYARRRGNIDQSALQEALRTFYKGEPFIRVVDRLPATKHTTGTNFCDLHACVVGERVVVVSCLDNMLKGASGAAVQNFNLMFGYAEETALR